MIRGIVLGIGGIEVRTEMRALLTFGLIGAIGYTSIGNAEPAKPAVPSEQTEVRAVVVDRPEVKAWRPGSGDIWDLLKSSGQLVDSVRARGQAEPDAIKLLTVGAATTIRSGPSSSAEILGLAPTGASVQAAAQYLEWVLIIDPWSWETGWIHSKALSPYAIPSTRAGAVLEAKHAVNTVLGFDDSSIRIAGINLTSSKNR
jgi:hypothetical protein